jgi:hypothetical protein
MRIVLDTATARGRAWCILLDAHVGIDRATSGASKVLPSEPTLKEASNPPNPAEMLGANRVSDGPGRMGPQTALEPVWSALDHFQACHADRAVGAPSVASQK